MVRVRHVLRRQQGAAGVAVAAVALVHQFQSLAQRREDDRVLADVVAAANRVNADLVGRTLADDPLAAVDEVPALHFLNDLREPHRGAAGRVLLEPVVPFHDLRVEALALERFRREVHELEQQVDHEAHVRNEQHRSLVRGGFDFGFLFGAVPGGGDDNGDLPVRAHRQHGHCAGGRGEVDQAIDARAQRHVVADRHADLAGAGGFARVGPLERVGGGVDSRDEVQLRIVFRQRH